MYRRTSYLGIGRYSLLCFVVVMEGVKLVKWRLMKRVFIVIGVNIIVCLLYIRYYVVCLYVLYFLIFIIIGKLNLIREVIFLKLSS